MRSDEDTAIVADIGEAAERMPERRAPCGRRAHPGRIHHEQTGDDGKEAEAIEKEARARCRTGP